MDYTPEQIAEMHDRNENFVGTKPDFSAIQRYNTILESARNLAKQCAYIMEVVETGTSRYEMNAVAYVDFSPIATMDAAAASQMADIMKLADRFSVSANNKWIRFSFGVERIWDDRRSAGRTENL